jgi:hypothetical protein
VAVQADLDITIGDSFWSTRWAVIIRGQAVDLTGWTVHAQIRPHADSATVLHTFAGSGIQLGTAEVLLDGDPVTTSTLQLYIPPAQTERFTPWAAEWDVQVEHSTFGPNLTPYVRTLVGGKATASWGVSR